MSTAKEMSPAEVAEACYGEGLRDVNEIRIVNRNGFALPPVVKVAHNGDGVVTISVAGETEIGEPQADYTTETAPAIGVPEPTPTEPTRSPFAAFALDMSKAQAQLLREEPLVTVGQYLGGKEIRG